MRKNTFVLIVGLLIFFMPFSGFPSPWKFWFYIIAGLALIISAIRHSFAERIFVIRRRDGRTTFTEHNPEALSQSSTSPQFSTNDRPQA